MVLRRMRPTTRSAAYTAISRKSSQPLESLRLLARARSRGASFGMLIALLIASQRRLRFAGLFLALSG
jgi:hypothetical protein